MKHRGEWDLAADWAPVWIGFGAEPGRHGPARATCRGRAHEALWQECSDSLHARPTVRFHPQARAGVSRIPLLTTSDVHAD